MCIAQSVDNVVTIELSQSVFPIERPFTISVLIANSDTRPAVVFPDIPGFSKKGTSASVTTSEVGGKTITNQIITQNYQARAVGRFRLAPFTITANGEVATSDGAILTVQPSAAAIAATATLPPSNDAAFLALKPSTGSIYTGEAVALTLSFYVADNYPYVLDFKALDQQLQTISRRIRPTNAWEESLNITDLKPIQLMIRGKKYREYRLFQSIFFPLSSQSLRIPSVSLWLTQTRPVIGPPAPETSKVAFTSRPTVVQVRALPPHPLRGRVPVGKFQLTEGLERQRVSIGKSVKYTFTVSGEGNIATLPAPALPNEGTDLAIFPPEERQVVNRSASQVTGRKTFSYFIVPHENKTISLADRFLWVYFDPQLARYDTLRPNMRLIVGGSGLQATGNVAAVAQVAKGDENAVPINSSANSLFAGIESMDSRHQPVSVSVLIRSVANVLIILMLLGMIFVFFKH
ncbi:BatD family protein [Spirosoma fluminis]